MENKKKKTLAIVLGIFALVIVTTTASFAFFTYSRTGKTTSTIISGDIEFSFIEGDSSTLFNAFPVADSVGAVDTTGEYSFDVRLASSSNSNKMNYNVLLVDNNDEVGGNYFNNEQIKFSLVKNNTYVANTSSTSGVKLSTIDGFAEASNQGEGIVLQDQEITAGTTDNYKLRIWISDDVNYSNTVDGQDNQESIGKYNSYKYSLKVKVTSGVATGDNLSEINIIMNVKNLTMTADIESKDGLRAYAVTTNSNVPLEDSNQWIDLNTSAKSNVVRTTNAVIQKRINYVANDNGRYYLHVKNNNNKIMTKSFDVIVDETNSSLYIMNLAKTNTDELRIDKHEPTGQQDFTTTEYRYYGKNPNNYVQFNNELWRIIGAMDVDDGTGNIEKRLKIVRANSIGNYSWDSSDSEVNSGLGINEWTQSDIMTLLNSGAYYNQIAGTCFSHENNETKACDFTTIGLTSEAKNMIGSAKWYLGTDLNEYTKLTLDDYYRAERSTLSGKQCSSNNDDCNDTVERKLYWIGEVGLAYLSDYGYSYDIGQCSTDYLTKYHSSTSCGKTSWIYDGVYRWYINPHAHTGNANQVLLVTSTGTLYVASARTPYSINPAIYLKSDVRIVDGAGTDQQPFILSK